MVEKKINPKNFFNENEKEKLVRAIQEAEDKTSGEIRVFLDKSLKGSSVMDTAKATFEKLGMTKTEKRNAVLIYFSLSDHAFSVIGDKGIHEKVGEGFWNDVVARMESQFVKMDLIGGLELGIREIGEQLKKYFPWEQSDRNELSDQVETN